MAIEFTYKSVNTLISLIIVLFLNACGSESSSSEELPSSNKISKEPVYVSVVLHYEETFNSMRPEFLKHRNNLVDLAEFLSKNDIKLNLQPDWAFMQAIEDLESDRMRLSTNGKNVLRYLVEDLGHEIDPHSHEGLYNFADVAYMIDNLGVTPSNVVGGFIASPYEESQYPYLVAPLSAKKFEYIWQPEWLWGGGTSGHVNDSYVSGIWVPKDAENFYVNDDSAPLPCIGRYTGDIEGVYEILNRRNNAEIEADKMLTASIFIGQGKVTEMHLEIVANLETLKTSQSNEDIVFASLSEVSDIWQTKYQAKGYLFLKPSDD